MSTLGLDTRGLEDSRLESNESVQKGVSRLDSADSTPRACHSSSLERSHKSLVSETMRDQHAKNKATESKIMGAADAVSALIKAVTERSADDVRAAAKQFKKVTKSDISGLGDAKGRTPMHLVRVILEPLEHDARDP